jgi:DNA-binding winged helix-turn-helix (wHTH) protein
VLRTLSDEAGKSPQEVHKNFTDFSQPHQGKKMQHDQLVCFGPYQLDVSNGQLRRSHQVLPLTNKAFEVLCCLVDHVGQLVTKEMLFQTVWADTVVTETALTNCISELRQILGDNPKKPRFIETVHRRGYRWVAAAAAPVPSSKFQAPSSKVHPSVDDQDSGLRTRDSIWVGREAELAQLRNLFAKAVSSQRQVVFVTGEAGIGKTTLVEAFLQSLEQASQSHIVQTLDPRRHTLDVSPWIGHGQCIEQYGAGEAYLPVLEALGRLGPQPGGERLLTILNQYAPTWLMQLPALLSAAELEAVQRRIQGATRERMRSAHISPGAKLRILRLPFLSARGSRAGAR